MGRSAVRSVTATARPIEINAYLWGPDWKGMSECAFKLAGHGLPYRLVTHQDKTGDANMSWPELHIPDSRNRIHVVTQGLWVVVYPERDFRVITQTELFSQYDINEVRE
jgi:hypothetical protein